jgi:hypothetical protein
MGYRPKALTPFCRRHLSSRVLNPAAVHARRVPPWCSMTPDRRPHCWPSRYSLADFVLPSPALRCAPPHSRPSLADPDHPRRRVCLSSASFQAVRPWNRPLVTSQDDVSSSLDYSSLSTPRPAASQPDRRPGLQSSRASSPTLSRHAKSKQPRPALPRRTPPRSRRRPQTKKLSHTQIPRVAARVPRCIPTGDGI